MPGKFVVKKGSTGKFRFNLVSTNGQVVASSEAYDSKQAAMRGIQSVRKLAPEATVDDQTAPPAKAAGGAKKAAKKTAKSTS